MYSAAAMLSEARISSGQFHKAFVVVEEKRYPGRFDCMTKYDWDESAHSQIGREYNLRFIVHNPSNIEKIA